ncbi:MAG TPA: SusC/RagA family TonB-linked outer membrane protein, partial [Saprospiraceae bacterium]|nr:SusC/RagA family TonB-linked outer membrane protein [Saprospiraceae bacterium]
MRNFQLSTVFLEKGKAVFTLLFLFFLSALQAQHIVRGTVTDQDNGSPLIGVSVFEESTPSNGTVTDIDGKFSLKVSSDQATIVASYVGFERERVPLEGRAELAIAMYASITLDEVVVTALGIQREKKALGYATQSLSGDELSAVRSTNLINSLSGKLAGVQVVGASNGIASSSRVVIRGENSLNINNNSPLFVVDGIPVNNNIYGVGSSSIDQADMPTDYGNGAAEINPEDIESVNVLKGAAASALYGARAANGVIVITTKSGKEQQGLGVSFSSSTLFSNPLRLPDVQNQYGGGWGLEYYSDFGTNFGPKLDAGLNVLQDGSPGYDSNTEEPFEYRYKLEDYFQTGLATNNQVSISGGNEKATFRLSYTNSYNEGIVPNTNLKRNYFNLNTAFHPAKNWSINLGANYIKSNSDNLPVAGYGGQGLMYAILWNYTNVDVDWLRNYWVEPDRVQRNIFTWADNPFLIINEHINAFNKDRLFGVISSTYNFTPDLSLMVRVGTDYSDDFRWSRRPVGSVYQRNGMYREQDINFRETNADFLLSYNKRFARNFSTKISVGGNRLDQQTSESFLEGRSLSIPGIYTLGNINVQPSMYRYNGKKRVNSLYAFANIGYKDFLYLDLTARNDWISTLIVPDQELQLGNIDVLYPSASMSFVFSELL